jgi:hypothetical protein
MSSLYGGRGPTGGLGNKAPRGYELGRLQNFTPEQMELFRSLFSQLGPESYLSKLAGGDEGIFQQIEAPALRQFTGLQGGLASRFSGMGSGARRSSGFQNAANQQASEFAESLHAQRQQLQRDALRDLFGMSNQLLSQRPYEEFFLEKPPSFLESLFGGLGNLFGMFGGSAAGRAGSEFGSRIIGNR